MITVQKQRSSQFERAGKKQIPNFDIHCFIVRVQTEHGVVERDVTKIHNASSVP